MKLKTKNTDTTKAAATATVEEPKAKTPKAPKEKAASKFVSADVIEGRRMRVSEYQDYTFSINDRKDRRLTDEELAADWRRQFPNAVAFTAFHVTGARRDYNKGVHSKAFPGAKDPAARPWFVASDGKRTQDTPKASAKQETPSAPKAPKAEAADTAPRKGKAKKAKAAAA